MDVLDYPHNLSVVVDVSTLGPSVSWSTIYNATEEPDDEPINLGRAVIVGMLLTLLVTMTIGGNVLVLLAVFVNSHLRSTTNYFITNLAIADLLLGTTVLPFSASLEVIKHWVFGQVFCSIWAAVDVLCCTASILSLCIISIDRYIGVTRPLQHSSIMTEKRAFYIIIVVWVLSILISVAPLLGWKEPPNPDPRVCSVTKQLGYVLFSASGSFYIPLLIILIVYFRVYREALTQSKFISTGIKTSVSTESSKITLRIHTGGAAKSASKNPYQSSSSSEQSEGSNRKAHSRNTIAGKIAKFKREKKAAKTLGIVVGVFIVCWFPFFFILPLEALCKTCYIPDWLFKIIFWLGYCNSMMNPIIYAASSREFKRAFIRILKCQFRRRPRYFLDEENSSTTTQVFRFTKGRRKSSRREKRLYAKQNGSSRFRSQNRAGSRRLMDKESPIASLRLLHNQRLTRENELMPDDDSAIHVESSDDDKSDISNEIADDVLEELNRESMEQKSQEHRESVLVHERQAGTNNATSSYQHIVPRIVLQESPDGDADDVIRTDQPPPLSGAYFVSDEDRIMWL